MQSRSRQEAGFTLVELLVAIVILGILVAIAVPSFLNQSDKAHDASAKQSLSIAYKVATSDAAFNNSNFRSASQLAAEVESSEPELGDVESTTDVSGVAASGKLYILSNGTPGGTGDFKAAMLSKSGHLCTATVTARGPVNIACSTSAAGAAISAYALVSGPTVNPGAGDSTASCAASSRVSGGGSQYVSAPNTATVKNHDLPNAASTAWMASVNVGGSSVKAQAVCIAITGGVTQVVGLTTSAPVGSDVTATASCPSGKVVIGGGYATNGGTFTIPRNRAISDSAWQVTAYYATSGGNFTPYAMCADAPVGYERVTGTTSPPINTATSALNVTATTSCPSGKKVLSGGFDVSSHFIHNITWNYATTSNTWSTQIRSGVDGQTVTSSAICATA